MIRRVSIVLGVRVAIARRGARHASRKRRGTARIGKRLIVGLTVVETISNMSDRKLVARLQSPHLDALTVDPDSVGAAQVADDHFAILLHHAAVVARDPEGIESGVAGRMTTHHNHGAIQHDILTFIEGHKSCGHGE